MICPTFTFYATAESIARRGAKPVFVDIDARTMNLDPSRSRARTTERTKAIMPVHLFGRPAALGELADLGIPIVEDAAQAFGAQGVGTTGVVSTYSFFPTKNLFALGDGGLDDDERRRSSRSASALLRFHGSKAKKDFELVGYNSRLDELQAAVLRLFLPHVDEWNRLRREAAARYAELGLGEVCELPADEPGHVYHVYVVRSPERDRIREHLAAAEIASSTYYETPLHRQPALRQFGQADGDFPETERAARENLALPMWAGIGADVQERVVSAVRDAVSAGGRSMRSPINRHRIWQIAADGVLIAVAWLLAFQLRFDSFEQIPPFYEKLVNWRTVLLVVAIKLAVFTAFGFYNRWWRYVSTRDMWGAARGVTVACLAASLVVYFFPPGDTAPAAARDRDPRLAAPARVSSPARACSRARSSSGPVRRASSRAARK